DSLKPRQTPDELLRQLTRIAHADPADQAQGPADQALRLADAVALIVGDQRLGIGGRLELRLEPAGIEQQRIELLALLSLREVVREKEVIVATGPGVGL